MEKRINFTKRSLTALKPPTDKRRAVCYDTKVGGLCLFVTQGGKKTFYVYRSVKGQPEQIKIGGFPDLTVEQARKRAAEINGLIAQGKNPQEALRKQRGELTLGDLFEAFSERHLEPYRRPSTVKEYRRVYDVHLSRWKRRRLSAISKRDIQELHSRIGRENGPYMANRVLALVSVLFTKARAWGLMEGNNPAQGVEKFKERSRDRFLQPDELPRFFQALAEEPNTAARECIMLCLMTGARRSNVQAMRWEDVSLERGTWRIPDTKSGEPVLVPLVPKAVEILQGRLEQAGDEPWVFPGTGKQGHLVELKSVWARILERAKIKDLRLHDLRRSLGSWMAAQGASLTVIGKGLGHKNTSTTAIYSRLNIDPVREAMERATEAMIATYAVVKEDGID